MISDEKLMEYASNDLRNKAAAKGANMVVAGPHQMMQSGGKGGGQTSTSTVTGVAYKCPLSENVLCFLIKMHERKGDILRFE